MLVRVEMVGEGTEESPYSVNYPTWNGKHVDYENGYMIVDVPDSTHPAIDTKRGIVKEHLTVSKQVHMYADKELVTEVQVTHRNVLTAVSPKLMQEWYDHLDKVYQEHKGRFRHKVV